MNYYYSGRQLFSFLGVPLNHSKYILSLLNHAVVEEKSSTLASSLLPCIDKTCLEIYVCLIALVSSIIKMQTMSIFEQSCESYKQATSKITLLLISADWL